jgi:hypothetical protein
MLYQKFKAHSFIGGDMATTRVGLHSGLASMHIACTCKESYSQVAYLNLRLLDFILDFQEQKMLSTCQMFDKH